MYQKTKKKRKSGSVYETELLSRKNTYCSQVCTSKAIPSSHVKLYEVGMFHNAFFFRPVLAMRFGMTWRGYGQLNVENDAYPRFITLANWSSGHTNIAFSSFVVVGVLNRNDTFCVVHASTCQRGTFYEKNGHASWGDHDGFPKR